MKHVLKAIAIAAALGTGALMSSPQASAHDYYRYHRYSGTGVYLSTGRVRVGYYRGYSRYDDDWRWRHRCYRYHRHDCGRHYGWRHRWRHRDW